MASVIATHLHRGYGEGAERAEVLTGLSIEFRPGELSMIMGASGSGKSTLLAVLGGLLRPESGSVNILGTSIWSLDKSELEHFRFHNCGYIFQGYNLFPALSALDQVALPLIFSGIARSAAERSAKDALHEVGLSARLQLRPAQLSGGEKQRVAIARALVKLPKILLADEPTSSLDSRNSEIVITLLQRIATTHGATVITVTHDSRLKSHADRIIELQDGAIINDVNESTATYLTAPIISESSHV